MTPIRNMVRKGGKKGKKIIGESQKDRLVGNDTKALPLGLG